MEVHGCFVVTVLITPYDGFTKMSSIELNHLHIWLQMHDIPDGYAPLVESLVLLLVIIKIRATIHLLDCSNMG